MSVTLHTIHGDLKIEVFCESVPKTAEVCTKGPFIFHAENIVVATLMKGV